MPTAVMLAGAVDEGPDEWLARRYDPVWSFLEKNL